MALLPRFPALLAQEWHWDEAPPPPTTLPARRPMTFSDLQQSLRDYNSGKIEDNYVRNGVLSLLAVIALAALIVHLRQRYKNAPPPDSIHRLGRELARLAPFPPGTRLLLKWVAYSTRTPLASLLLSAGLFDKCVGQWAAMPTFALARHWGKARLERLRPMLFEQSDTLPR